MKTLTLQVNGKAAVLRVDDPDMPLLYALRNDLNLKGTHFGCGLGQCGACTVHVGGVSTRSCLTPCSSVRGPITTIEGLSGDPRAAVLLQAFEEEQAAQCGYCTSGMVMAAADLLRRNPKPTRPEIVAALEGNLCRCGTHQRYVNAVEKAAHGSTRSAA